MVTVDFIDKKTDEVIFSTSEDNANDIIKDIDIIYDDGVKQKITHDIISIDDIEYIVDSIAWIYDRNNPLSFPLDKVYLLPTIIKKKGDDDVSIP